MLIHYHFQRHHLQIILTEQPEQSMENRTDMACAGCAIMWSTHFKKPYTWRNTMSILTERNRAVSKM